MSILVTGATGQIGSELVGALRQRYGADHVIASARRPGNLPAPFELLDVTDRSTVEKVVSQYKVRVIYHLAAVLSATGEQDPQRAWNVNVGSLLNVLEVARNHGVHQVFFPSSIAVFGPNVPRDRTPQEACLNPTTMYGVTKVTGELLCDYYTRKYGVDVRGLRYPGIISSETPPGGGTTDYAVEIFYAAVEKGTYTCFLREDTRLPMMYMPDCLRAAIELLEAPNSRLRYRVYNITAMSFTPGEIAAEIRKHIPGLRVEYKPDFRQAIADSWPRSIDDSPARDDWGWKAEYNLPQMVQDMLARLRGRQAKLLSTPS